VLTIQVAPVLTRAIFRPNPEVRAPAEARSRRSAGPVGAQSSARSAAELAEASRSSPGRLRQSKLVEKYGSFADFLQHRAADAGVALFDRKRRTTEYKAADSGYVSAWYFDEDYDGDCFVDCQIFFDFKKTPNIKAALRAEVDPDEFTLKLDSEPFPVRGYKRIAVKVVDVYGNESTVVRDLAQGSGTMAYVVDRVVICDAFHEPERDYQLLPGGRSKRVETRRPSMHFLASAKDVKGGIAGVVGKEAQIFEDLSAAAAEQNEFVNQLRDEVRAWREAGYPGTAVVTRRLLEWWFERDEERKAVARRFFFCQQEAVETVIYLYEVQGRRRMPETGDLLRYALKLATGTGKTAVMALFVTWATGERAAARRRAQPRRRAEPV